MQKVDRRERILDNAWNARKDEFGEGRYGKASVVRAVTFAFAEECGCWFTSRIEKIL